MKTSQSTSLRYLITVACLLIVIKIIPWESINYRLTDPPVERSDITVNSSSVVADIAPTPAAPAPEPPIEENSTHVDHSYPTLSKADIDCEQNMASIAPTQLICTDVQHTDKQYLLNQLGTYPEGGGLNHHFNNVLLAPIIHTPESQIIRYMDQLWYKAPRIPTDAELLLSYVARKLHERTLLPADRISAHIRYLLQKSNTPLISLLHDGNRDAIDAYVSQHSLSLSEQTISELITVLPAWLTLRKEDNLYQELRALYIAFGLFNIKQTLLQPELSVMRLSDGTLYFPELSYTNIEHSDDSLPAFDFLVRDFTTLTTNEDKISPSFKQQTLSPLILWSQITLTDIRNQIDHITQSYLISDDRPIEETPLYTLYQAAYPHTKTAGNRAASKIETIRFLNGLFYESSQHEPSTATPPNTDITTLWADGHCKEFKKLQHMLERRLMPAPDNHLFNPNQGLYQPPYHSFELLSGELAD